MNLIYYTLLLIGIGHQLHTFFEIFISIVFLSFSNFMFHGLFAMIFIPIFVLFKKMNHWGWIGLFFVAAIYFNGLWQYLFPSADRATVEAEFIVYAW
ncbi:hypothetical protein QDY71_00560 [Kingella negevensis]|nr:hypothetical protein [Kingella negevensis]MDK4684567.1 hypothetical protein [Kingella negevensis]MDK4696288.1 hypothetical protein [Kingella negevensis]MDK4707697.1 hypothetical protein [Kingella negevensis]MDK4709867.1 hypothetical protein [Kingella negevensis]